MGPVVLNNDPAWLAFHLLEIQTSVNFTSHHGSLSWTFQDVYLEEPTLVGENPCSSLSIYGSKMGSKIGRNSTIHFG